MIRNRVKSEKKEYARWMRSNPTEAEEYLWQYLRRKQLGYRFRRQAIIRGYITDFFCPQVKVVVEVDGPYHKNRVAYDRRRDEALERLGIMTLRFENTEVVNHIERVVAHIRTVLDRRREQGVKPFPGKVPKAKRKMNG